MESISPLPECERQGNEVSALAKVADKMCAAGGGSRAGDENKVDSGGHPTRRVPQGRVHDRGGHKVGIPRGNEGNGGGVMERASGLHAPPE